MSHPAQGKGRDPSLPALGPVGTTGIDGKANAAGRRRAGFRTDGRLGGGGVRGIP
ncbi:MAG: hypothetical protein QG573_811 [Acidobacteriota bacterium]|nr:hypothetical protein [Acidobacteriota bacterium]